MKTVVMSWIGALFMFIVLLIAYGLTQGPFGITNDVLNADGKHTYEVRISKVYEDKTFVADLNYLTKDGVAHKKTNVGLSPEQSSCVGNFKKSDIKKGNYFIMSCSTDFELDDWGVLSTALVVLIVALSLFLNLFYIPTIYSNIQTMKKNRGNTSDAASILQRDLDRRRERSARDTVSGSRFSSCSSGPWSTG